MASNLRVDTILPSTGTTLGIGTASGTINFLGNSNIDTSGTLTAASASITGNLGVGGTITYEDVTNVDSVGVITARNGIKVTSGDILLTGGDGRKISFAGDGSAHYIKMDNSFNGPVINGYGGIKFETNGTNERLRIGSAGQLGIGGANYGTSGQVLTSAGSGSAVQWATPAGGKILQVVNVFKGDGFTTNSTSFTDITGLSISITPSSTSSKIMLSCSMGAAGVRINNGDYGNGIRVMRDIGGGGYSNDNKLNGAADGSRDRITFKGHGWSYNNDHMPGGVGFTGVDDPNTTSAVTYKVQVVCQSSSYAFFLNRNSTNGNNSSVAQARSMTSLIAMEIGG